MLLLFAISAFGSPGGASFAQNGHNQNDDVGWADTEKPKASTTSKETIFINNTVVGQPTEYMVDVSKLNRNERRFLMRMAAKSKISEKAQARVKELLIKTGQAHQNFLNTITIQST